MISINGKKQKFKPGQTVLEAAIDADIYIPTLCTHSELSPFGACRLCLVEIGKGDRAKLVSSCTYPAEEGLIVRTASSRVLKARKMMIELLLASCPQSKIIQDIAAKLGLDWNRRITMNYLEMFDIVKKGEGFAFNDITFENFKDITLDATKYVPLFETWRC